MTHLIRHLSFGKDYPGIVNPLDDTNVTAPQGQSIHVFFVLFHTGYSKRKVDLKDHTHALFRISGSQAKICRLEKTSITCDVDTIILPWRLFICSAKPVHRRVSKKKPFHKRFETKVDAVVLCVLLFWDNQTWSLRASVYIHFVTIIKQSERKYIGKEMNSVKGRSALEDFPLWLFSF